MHIGAIIICLLLIIQSAMPQMGCAETYNLLGTFLIWNIIMELYHETYMPSNTCFYVCIICFCVCFILNLGNLCYTGQTTWNYKLEDIKMQNYENAMNIMIERFAKDSLIAVATTDGERLHNRI